jgi:hypothetical protein
MHRSNKIIKQDSVHIEVMKDPTPTIEDISPSHSNALNSHPVKPLSSLIEWATCMPPSFQNEKRKS